MFIINNDTINKNSIQELFYLTSIKNLESILTNGILSHKRANRLEDKPADISNNDVQDRRAKKIIERAVPEKKPLSLHRHAPLFMNPHNQMTYACSKRDQDLCILRIYPEVLQRGDAVMTDKNAATDDATFFHPSAFCLDKEQTAMIASQRPIWHVKYAKPSEEQKTLYRQLRQAEVLLPFEIHPYYIGGIFVPSEEIKEKILSTVNQHGKLPIEVQPTIFHIPHGSFVEVKKFQPLRPQRSFPNDFKHEYPDSSDTEEEDEPIRLKRTSEILPVKVTQHGFIPKANAASSSTDNILTVNVSPIKEKGESVHPTVSKLNDDPQAVGANSLVEKNNLAVQAFLGDGSEQNPSHLHFHTWYHPDVCHYLLQLVPNQARCVRVIFSDADDGNNTKTFKDQLQQLLMLSNVLQRPAIFISKEPGADNHFICGLVKGNNLLLINPLGITDKIDCYQTIFKLKEDRIIGEVWFSSNRLQKIEYEEEGLVSCGAVSLELATHILSQITADKLEEFLNQLKTNEPTIHAQPVLIYHGVNIQDLLPESLKTLERAGDENTYKDQACSIRANHLKQLKELPEQNARAESMATEEYLKTCKESALAQVLFNMLVTKVKDIANIVELPEYKLFEEHLNAQVTSAAFQINSQLGIPDNSQNPLVTQFSEHSQKGKRSSNGQQIDEEFPPNPKKSKLVDSEQNMFHSEKLTSEVVKENSSTQAIQSTPNESIMHLPNQSI